jgi:hypothetical protein
MSIVHVCFIFVLFQSLCNAAVESACGAGHKSCYDTALGRPVFDLEKQHVRAVIKLETTYAETTAEAYVAVISYEGVYASITAWREHTPGQRRKSPKCSMNIPIYYYGCQSPVNQRFCLYKKHFSMLREKYEEQLAKQEAEARAMKNNSTQAE